MAMNAYGEIVRNQNPDPEPEPERKNTPLYPDLGDNRQYQDAALTNLIVVTLFTGVPFYAFLAWLLTPVLLPQYTYLRIFFVILAAVASGIIIFHAALLENYPYGGKGYLITFFSPVIVAAATGLVVLLIRGMFHLTIWIFGKILGVILIVIFLAGILSN